MGFELFIQRVEVPSRESCSKEDITDSFSCARQTMKGEMVELLYDDLNYCTLDFSLNQSGELNGFTVFRPCEDINLWNSLYEVIKNRSFIMYCPGLQNIIVGDSDVIAHIPRGIREAFEGCIVVDSGTQIKTTIENGQATSNAV